ncbi:MAG: hypothetical protein LBC80_05000 [Treponema sp.]|jgi:hypothetical protein|nr:hypothetical protein [Treponema sp.]
MKYLFVVAAFLCSAVLFADNPPVFNWSLLLSGSWEESKTLHNREDFRLNFLPYGLTFRAGILDRRTLNFDLGPPEGDSWNAIWGDPNKAVTNLFGGLYHRPTGSRLLFGVIDEWGLSARIRNPWIRSPPYPENHKPLMADLKTAASSTKNDEAYLYLSSPFFDIYENIKLRGFVSAQSEIENLTPAFAGGVDFIFPKKTNLLFEVFYTGATLPPTKRNSWFSNPPPLPEREFDLYAAGILFSNPLLSVSSDFAVSETFAWGTNIYSNFGITVTPSLPIGHRARPLAVSVAADGAGERFIYRDGANHGEGFRAAGKIEWRGVRNSLFRLNTVLRSPGIDEDYTRSSTGLYYRFPAVNWNRENGSFPVRVTRVSLTADRNADNSLKINDRLSGYVGFSVNLRQLSINTPLGINLSGSIRGLTEVEDNPSPYPVPNGSRVLETSGMNCELIWSPKNLQFRSRVGYTKNPAKDDKWDFSLSTAARLKRGRISIKAASPNFPENWNWTMSWRMEKIKKTK